VTIVSNGGSAITDRGFCWDTSPNPENFPFQRPFYTDANSFSGKIPGLSANTTYYVRAYAINSIGIGYSNEFSLKTLDVDKSINFNAGLTYGTMTDIEGNVYKTITIGTQTWMAENLRTTKYRNGDLIPNVTIMGGWSGLNTSAYCWYNNDANSYKLLYGAMYNWYAVADTRNIAPVGWHIPTDAEWATLINYCGGQGVAAGPLKESGTTHWVTDSGATNSSGFSALPGGSRGAFFNLVGDYSYTWSSTEISSTNAGYILIVSDINNCYRFDDQKMNGFNVRCIKDELMVPTVTTNSISSVSNSSATSGGNIVSDGGSSITERGICYNTSSNPTTANFKITNGTGSGSFTSNLTGLAAGTTYYIRAYATNSLGTAYGNELTVTTTAILPVLTTAAATSLTTNSLTIGGTITTDGGSTVTARGVCWSTTQNPTTANSKTTDGTGPGTFVSSITGLTLGTTYYISAYATNSIGTAYGTQVTITTTPIVPTLTTTAISAITSNTATSGGNITSDGGSAVTARGVRWSTSPSPTFSDSKTTDGSGSGAFTSNLSSLTENTTYYIRAYATNIAGTGFGNEITFKTLISIGPIIFNPDLTYGTMTDVDGNVYKTITIGTQTWMAENLKTTRYRNGEPIPNVTATWAGLTTGAYCWFNNDATTYKATYGALYNWYAVADSRNIAPTGWHVPTDAEWTTLTTFLGGESVAGGKLKETGTSHWIVPNSGATNSSGFAALPGGSHYYQNSVGVNGNWWSITVDDATFARGRGLDYYYTNVSFNGYDKKSGFSIRCVKD
jgi:uncharacterized protein (TIGR02145 family)